MRSLIRSVLAVGCALATFPFAADDVGVPVAWLEPGGLVATAFPGQRLRLRFRVGGLAVASPPSGVPTFELQVLHHDEWTALGQLLECWSDDGVRLFEFRLPADDPAVEDYHPSVVVGTKLAVRVVSVGADGSRATTEERTMEVVPIPDVILAFASCSDEEWIPEGRPFDRAPVEDGRRVAGNQVGLTATLNGATPASRVLFELIECSAEPGVCMNYGSQGEPYYDDPDLQFLLDEEANPSEDFEAVPGTSGLAIMTTAPVELATVTITSFDYGAHGVVRATLVDEQGGPIGRPSEPVRIPLDANGNHIADAWRAIDRTPLDTMLDPEWDEEIEDWLAGDDGVAPGDGLTRYEEYRGVMTRDQEFLRLDPRLREVFVFRENAEEGVGGLEDFLLVVDITAEQMNGAAHDRLSGVSVGTQRRYDGDEPVGPRVVNFNYGSHHRVDQHGLWLDVRPGVEEAPPPDGEWGAAYDRFGRFGLAEGALGPSSPGNRGRITVFKGNILRDCGPVTGALFEWDASEEVRRMLVRNTVLHELSHGLSVEHHERDCTLIRRSSRTIHRSMADCRVLHLEHNGYPDASKYPLTGDDAMNEVWIHWTGEMGALTCVMRDNNLEMLAATAGDRDYDGEPDAGDSDDPDWRTVLTQLEVPEGRYEERLCGEPLEAGQPEAKLAGAVHDRRDRKDGCRYQIIVNDARGP